MTASDAAPAPAPVRYRFGDVALDVAAMRLTVAGVEPACSARTLHLLRLLCGAPGKAFTRDELIEALWPGRRVVSDESLSQIVFKLRAALGADGARVVTVRGVGVRLEGDVDALSSASPVTRTDTAAIPAPTAVPVAAPTRSRRHVWLAVAAALAVALAVGTWAYRRAIDDAQWAIARGWGLARENLHAANADSADVLRQALAADANGDRPRARVLLASLHDGDRTTPVPALLLAIWAASAGETVQAQAWTEQARSRASAAGDALIAAYVALSDSFARAQGADLQASLAAVLDRRPDAWILRQARAQLLRQRGQAAAALAELQRIPVERLDDRRLEEVLADRASLGDPAGARALYEALPDDANAVGRSAVGARLAYTAGDVASARAGFARTVELALAQGRTDWIVRGQLLAAALAAELGDDADARRRANDAAGRAREARDTLVALDANLMLAQLAALRGDARERDEAMQRAQDDAARIADPVWTHIVRIVALRLGTAAPAVATLVDADIAVRGIAPLADGWQALRDGNHAAAAARLDAALDVGAGDSIVSDETALLAQALGRSPPAPARRDPPAAPYFRLVSRTLFVRTIRR